MLRFFRGIARKLWGKPTACFVACTFAEDVIQKHGRTAMDAIYSFFGDVLPYDEGESQMAEAVSASRDHRLFQVWCDLCLKRRKAYLPLLILPMETEDRSSLEKFLAAQGWVRGYAMTTGPMTDTYAYILNGLRQQIMVPQWIPDLDEKMWRTLTITLGPVPLHDYDPHEPLNIATKQAADAGITVVVAAGNEGRIYAGNSLNPWSLAPWVIGVGASTEDGATLLEVSSRGTPDRPDWGPTVVAPGESSTPAGALDHGHLVAIEHITQAPPGAMEMTVVGSNVFIYLKKADGQIVVRMMKGEQPSPEIPLEGLVKLLESLRGARAERVSGTSFAAEYVAALAGNVAKELKNRRSDLPVGARPKLLKTVLEDMARPMPDYKPWEVGKGLVTYEIARAYLRSLSNARLDSLSARAVGRW